MNANIFWEPLGSFYYINYYISVLQFNYHQIVPHAEIVLLTFRENCIVVKTQQTSFPRSFSHWNSVNWDLYGLHCSFCVFACLHFMLMVWHYVLCLLVFLVKMRKSVLCVGCFMTDQNQTIVHVIAFLLESPILYHTERQCVLALASMPHLNCTLHKTGLVDSFFLMKVKCSV